MESDNVNRERKDSMEIKRILVGVAGGSGAGKSYFCSKVLSEIHYTGHFKVTIISLDDFYKTLD
jgi:uridine kinase